MRLDMQLNPLSYKTEEIGSHFIQALRLLLDLRPELSEVVNVINVEVTTQVNDGYFTSKIVRLTITFLDVRETYSTELEGPNIAEINIILHVLSTLHANNILNMGMGRPADTPVQ